MKELLEILHKRGFISDEDIDTILKDVYVAVNAQYHDYILLYDKWFNKPDEYIIKSAILFWFMDDDYTGNKVKDYFNL